MRESVLAYGSAGCLFLTSSITINLINQLPWTFRGRKCINVASFLSAFKLMLDVSISFSVSICAFAFLLLSIQAGPPHYYLQHLFFKKQYI